MKQDACATTKDLLPAYLSGDVSESDATMVGDHLMTCEDCKLEAELIGQLRATTPMPRGDLAVSVSQSLRVVGAGSPTRSWWIAAAATVVLALGTSVVWDRVQENPGAIVLGEQVDSDFWPGDGTLIAGGLVWDELSDEEMKALLEDWDDEA